MLRLTVEIVPLGDESKKRKIGHVEIVNNLSHKNRPTHGNYDCTITDKYGTTKVSVNDHYRPDGFWVLVVRSIKSLKRERRKC